MRTLFALIAFPLVAISLAFRFMERLQTGQQKRELERRYDKKN